jgi:NADH oxidase (H2O2-forming)
LRRVCVVGGGPAGVEAALAGAREGATVALFEGSPRLPTPRSEWPELIRGPRSSAGEAQAGLAEAGVDVRYEEPVSEVGRDLAVVSPSGRHRFDSVVVSTGTTCAPMAFPGSTKPGVHTLASQASHSELREACIGYSRVVLAGTGWTVLGVAERLAEKGIQVTISAPGGVLLSRFCAQVQRFVLTAASERGISVRGSPIRKAIGVDRVEAAFVGGEVLPCDGVVVVPRRVPSFPAVPAEIGPSGGIIVDSRMSSTASDLYAAGGCAEHPAGNGSFSFMPGLAARASGGVAGSNAAGGRGSPLPVGAFSRRILGLTVASAGLGLEEARAAGYDALESSSDTGERSACSIVFEARSGRILGVQHVAREGAPTLELFTLAVSKGVLLGDIARLEHTGSTDISAVLEAASEGMKLWQRS